jgi:hypothetical protein
MRNIVKLKRNLLIIAGSISMISVSAREKQGLVFKNSSNSQKVMAACSAPQSVAELSLNNVRTLIFSGSDMWWDLFGGGDARYGIPKGTDWATTASSNFAGNVWFGGLDVSNQLKVAAQTYRQGGIDFWTGPLNQITSATSDDVCRDYDKIFRLTRKDVDDYVLKGLPMTDAIRNWPGNGDISKGHDPILAPYLDVNASGDYDPQNGDYPYYDVYNNLGHDALGVCKARVFGDETLWWVYNDNGDVHINSGGKAIGLEVRAQAFAFKTTDEINNMTFYNYQIINRSSFDLYDTYMTVWTDADLGYYGDDYIGCDVKRGLGYIYNGQPNDPTVGSTIGYGDYLPALGCDFFQGPLADPNDGIDNDGDGTADELGEQLGMSIFNYFNNSFAGVPVAQTDPDNAAQFYQYMTGFWRDGTPFTCGGNAYGGSIPTKFVYPALTYTNGVCGAATWDDSGPGGDRRFMQSSGPFTLKPGAVNYVTFGLPWARSTASNDNKAAIPLLKVADDKAQALFDNCFKVLNGPEAPDITVQELENELILYFSNKPGTNNYLNNYTEKDVTILPTPNVPNPDNFYRFEGFKVYQLKNDQITIDELNDPSKAKLVLQTDIENGVTRLINYEFDATTGGDLPKVKAEGLDNGIKTSYRFTTDLFSSAADKKVVNHKEYYFMTVAYGYNQYLKYKEDVTFSQNNFENLEGQKRPYLQGRLVKKAIGIPHNPDSEKEGSIMQSAYGYGPKITRIEGYGNGGNSLELTQASINNILADGGRVNTIEYENGRGPISIKVVDPLNVPNSNFTVRFVNANWHSDPNRMKLDPCRLADSNKVFTYKTLTHNLTTFGKVLADSTTWILKDMNSGKEYFPCKSIKIGEEYYFSDLGLSVIIGQVGDPANRSNPAVLATDNIVQEGDLIEGSISFADGSLRWLSGVPDVDGAGGYNWIRSGGYVASPADNDLGTQNDYQTASGFADPSSVFEKVLGGTWSPYALCAATKTNAANPQAVTYAAPGYDRMVNTSGGTETKAALVQPPYDLRALCGVDVVLTKDKSKWTRAIVLEECDEASANPTGAKKLESRRSRSVDKQGIALGAPGCNTSEAYVDSSGGGPINYGLGWFPGYAINVETGERLNIAFGEDSYQNSGNNQAANNGGDMIWNPTASIQGGTNYPYHFGGRHYIYVFGHSRSSTTYNSGTPPISALNGKLIGVGTYKDFAQFAATYKWAFQQSNSKVLNNIWSDAMWVNIPVLSDAKYSFKDPANMPCDAKVRLRVKKAYAPVMSGSVYTNVLGYVSAIVETPTMPFTATSTVNISTDVLATAQNNNFNLYSFNTSDIFTEVNNGDKLKSALDLINVVPNPYYGYSTYERSRIENKMRITNLPNKCKIKIFTMNGTLIRTFDRDVAGQEDVLINTTEYARSKRLSYLEWDLKNQSGIVVASGLYIIHIDVPGVGEKILKWFGVMRPLDLQSY